MSSQKLTCLIFSAYMCSLSLARPSSLSAFEGCCVSTALCELRARRMAYGLTKSRCDVHLVTSTDGRRHHCCCLDTGRRHVASIAVGIIFRPRPKRATSPFRSQFVAQVLYSHAALTHSSHTLCSYTFLIYTLLLMHCTTHALFSHTTLIHSTLTLHS